MSTNPVHLETFFPALRHLSRRLSKRNVDRFHVEELCFWTYRQYPGPPPVLLRTLLTSLAKFGFGARLPPLLINLVHCPFPCIDRICYI